VQYNTLVGGANNQITSVAPSATSGVPLISQGNAADPAFGTAVVEGGGTGVTSTTPYSLICGGTTSTGPLQSASTGVAGQFLISGGPAALPTWGGTSPEAYFAATKTTNITNVTGDASPLSPMIFDNVLANHGSAYDPLTGIFTLPSDGLYFFFVNIRYQGLTSAHTLERLLIRDGGIGRVFDGYRNPFPSYTILGTPSGINVGHGFWYGTAGQGIFVDWLLQGGPKTISVVQGKAQFFGYKVGN
jgi:hypothetical protein